MNYYQRFITLLLALIFLIPFQANTGIYRTKNGYTVQNPIPASITENLIVDHKISSGSGDIIDHQNSDDFALGGGSRVADNTAIDGYRLDLTSDGDYVKGQFTEFTTDNQDSGTVVITAEIPSHPTSHNNFIIGNDGTNGNYIGLKVIADGNGSIGILGDNYLNRDIGYDMPTNTKVRFGYAWDQNKLYFYVNGSFVYSTTDGSNIHYLNSSDIHYGTWGEDDASPRWLTGYIDNVKWYDVKKPGSFFTDDYEVQPW